MPTVATVGLAAMLTVCLLATGEAFGHSPMSGTYQSSPFLALIFLAAAGSAIFAVLVKRVSSFVCIYLLAGSAIAFCFANAEIERLRYQISTFDPLTEEYYQTMSYVMGGSIGGLVSGAVFTGYYLLAVRPNLCRITK